MSTSRPPQASPPPEPPPGAERVFRQVFLSGVLCVVGVFWYTSQPIPPARVTHSVLVDSPQPEGAGKAMPGVLTAPPPSPPPAPALLAPPLPAPLTPAEGVLSEPTEAPAPPAPVQPGMLQGPWQEQVTEQIIPQLVLQVKYEEALVLRIIRGKRFERVWRCSAYNRITRELPPGTYDYQIFRQRVYEAAGDLAQPDIAGKLRCRRQRRYLMSIYGADRQPGTFYQDFGDPP